MEDGFASTSDTFIASLKPNLGNQIGKRCSKPLAAASSPRSCWFSRAISSCVWSSEPSIIPCWNDAAPLLKAAAPLLKGTILVLLGCGACIITGRPKIGRGGTTMPLSATLSLDCADKKPKAGDCGAWCGDPMFGMCAPKHWVKL